MLTLVFLSNSVVFHDLFGDYKDLICLSSLCIVVAFEVAFGVYCYYERPLSNYMNIGCIVVNAVSFIFFIGTIIVTLIIRNNDESWLNTDEDEKVFS